MTVRVGQGFDVHAFSDDPARKLVLGGVVFDGERVHVETLSDSYRHPFNLPEGIEEDRGDG